MWTLEPQPENAGRSTPAVGAGSDRGDAAGRRAAMVLGSIALGAVLLLLLDLGGLLRGPRGTAPATSPATVSDDDGSDRKQTRTARRSRSNRRAAKREPHDRPDETGAPVPHMAGNNGQAPPSATPIIADPRARNGTMIGQVVDQAGMPVAFADILIWWGTPEAVEWNREDRREQTDVDGRFTIHDLASGNGAGRDFLVCAESSDHRGVHALTGNIRASMAIDSIRIVMHPLWNLPGDVFTQRGVGVAGAVIEARSEGKLRAQALGQSPLANESTGFGAQPEGSWVRPAPLPRIRTRTSPGGGFQLHLTPEEWLVQVHHDDFPDHLEWIWDEPYMDIWLESGVALFGTVTDRDGEPIDGAAVSLFTEYETRGPVLTDAAGRYLLEGVCASDPGTVLFSGPRHALASRAFQPVGIEIDEFELNVSLSPERRVEGIVVGAGGRPVRGARVLLMNARDYRLRSRADLPLSQTTDGDGRFVFDRLPAGAIELVTRPPVETHARFPASRTEVAADVSWVQISVR